MKGAEANSRDTLSGRFQCEEKDKGRKKEAGQGQTEVFNFRGLNVLE